MVAFFSILIAVVLLGITVYGLHRYQTMEVEYHVDRTMPLPPLNSSEQSGAASETPAAETDSEDEVAAQEATPTPTPAPAPAEPRTADRSNWLARVAELKREGELDQALAVCEQEFPLWGAYNQACIVHRARLKQYESDKDKAATLLQRLYRLAAIAELLHDKSDPARQLSPPQLKELDLSGIEELDFPYAQIGYAHLRLVRKSDIKLMQSLWGRPDQHQLPRQYHDQWWQDSMPASG